MLFNSLAYFAFFLIVLALFYVVPLRWRPMLLLLASYYFYASWNPRFIPLLLGLTVVDYLAAHWIEQRSGRSRQAALILSIAANLGFLACFKYYNFLAANWAGLLGQPPQTFALSIVLPLGISFHTFQSISYIVDVYRREQRAIRNFLDYALFISFFPQLVAGPIVRARDFFRDLDNWRAPTSMEVRDGCLQIGLGLVKKIVLADSFAQFVNPYFQAVSQQAGVLNAWSAVIGFALQIYFDFSGYTDIAIGSARLLGFHFPINFRRPYLATSVTDFWRRWHISLSTWLRDYVYIPLGGNRHGTFATYRNLLLTMLLGGLWHGASWNFVIWGGYHGSLLATERLFGIKASERPTWLQVPRIPLTFVLVLIGWVFFRATTLHDAMTILSQMAGAAPRGTWVISKVFNYAAGVTLIVAIVEERFQLWDRLPGLPDWAIAPLLGFFLLLVELLGATQANTPFIYFQF